MRRQTCGQTPDVRAETLWCVPQKPTTIGFEADASADVKYLPQTRKSPPLHIGGRIRRWRLQMHLLTCRGGIMKISAREREGCVTQSVRATATSSLSLSLFSYSHLFIHFYFVKTHDYVRRNNEQLLAFVLVLGKQWASSELRCVRNLI